MRKKDCEIAGKNDPKIFIRISEKGEICAWGLELEAEKQLLISTGNQDLSEQSEAMSFNLCG